LIESSSNPQIKKIRKLIKNARFRRDEKLFVAEGWKMTEEAVENHLARAVYVSESAVPEWERRRILSENDLTIPVEYVASPLFQELSDTVTPQGVITLVEMPVYDMEELSIAGDALLLLENIQDPGNLGTMIRTAEGAGMSGIVLSRDCVDLFNPKVVRATMGAILRVPYYVADQLSTTVEKIKNDGFRIYAAHLAGQRTYTEESFEGKAGILIGNEANGLSEEISACADVLLKIPMEGKLESLNAAVSASLFMYEIHRKRNRIGG
jgi:TrmH family RNA methyltransferase